MFQTGLLGQSISSNSLCQFDGDTLSANQQEQLVDALHRFRYRYRIVQVAESDLYRTGKCTWLGLLAGQSPHVCAAPKKRPDHLNTHPARCTCHKNLHCFVLQAGVAALKFATNQSCDCAARLRTIGRLHDRQEEKLIGHFSDAISRYSRDSETRDLQVVRQQGSGTPP